MNPTTTRRVGDVITGAVAATLVLAAAVAMVIGVSSYVRGQSAAPTDSPAPPTAVTATATADGVSLTWAAPTTGATPDGYRVLRRRVGLETAFTTIAARSPGTVWLDTDRHDAGQRLIYRVVSLTGAAESAPSSPAKATALAAAVVTTTTTTTSTSGDASGDRAKPTPGGGLTDAAMRDIARAEALAAIAEAEERWAAADHEHRERAETPTAGPPPPEPVDIDPYTPDACDAAGHTWVGLRTPHPTHGVYGYGYDRYCEHAEMGDEVNRLLGEGHGMDNARRMAAQNLDAS